MAQNISKIERDTEVDRHLPVFIRERTHIVIEVDFKQQLSSKSHRGILAFLIKERDEKPRVAVGATGVD
jgi:hypothetical protein